MNNLDVDVFDNQEKKTKWFDKHVIITTLSDDKEKEKKIKDAIKKAFNK